MRLLQLRRSSGGCAGFLRRGQHRPQTRTELWGAFCWGGRLAQGKLRSAGVPGSKTVWERMA